MKSKITLAELLDELDGDGIIWVDSDLTTEALRRLGLSNDTEIEQNFEDEKDNYPSIPGYRLDS